MSIVIQDPQNVFSDGENLGAVGDAIANNKAIAPEIQRALTAWNLAREKWHAEAIESLGQGHDQKTQEIIQAADEAMREREESHAAAIKNLTTQHATEIEELRTAHAAALAALQTELDAAKQVNAEMVRDNAAKLDALKLSTKADRDALQATIDRQAALIETLGGTELGQKMQRDAEHERLLKTKAEVEAKIADIEKSKSAEAAAEIVQ